MKKTEYHVWMHGGAIASLFTYTAGIFGMLVGDVSMGVTCIIGGIIGCTGVSLLSSAVGMADNMECTFCHALRPNTRSFCPTCGCMEGTFPGIIQVLEWFLVRFACVIDWLEARLALKPSRRTPGIPAAGNRAAPLPDNKRKRR